MTLRILRAARGTSAIEALVVVAIGIIVTAAIASQAVHLGRQARTMTRRLRSLELARDLTRAFDQQKACDCNLAGLSLQPSPSGSYQAVFPKTKILKAGCAPSALVLAQPGETLPGQSYQLAVSEIAIKRLQPLNGAYGVATQFTGSLEVEFDPDSTSLGVPPVTMRRLFYVKNNQIVRCGPSQHKFFAVWGDTPVTNDLDMTTVASVACPADSEVVGGGFQTMGASMPLGCEIGMYTMETLSSYPDRIARTWNVLARCRTILPVAMCRRTAADD